MIGRADGIAALLASIPLAIVALVSPYLAMSGAGIPTGKHGHLMLQVEAATYRRGAFRLVYPASLRLDSARAERTLRVLSSAASIRGVPVANASGREVTVSLATEFNRSADAVTFPERRLIVVPLKPWLSWTPRTLERVLLHEMGHIAMADFLGEIVPPRWLSEGLAEWSTGLLTCEFETMLRLDLLNRREEFAHQVLSGSSPLSQSALEIAYFSTFVSFLDRNGDVSSGRMLRQIRLKGVDAGIKQVFRSDVMQLSREWWRIGLKPYRSGSVAAQGCNQKDPAIVR